MDAWLLQNLACPRHHTALSQHVDVLTCSDGCSFPLVEGVPVMLLAEAHQTIDLANSSLSQSGRPGADGGLYVDPVGVTDEQKCGILRLAESKAAQVDPVVSLLIGATNGIAYQNQIGRLAEYPIPRLRLPVSQGQVFLDIGCSWGRWCISAARKGYKVIGMDPSLGAVMAARRVARQLGVEVQFIVGDARFLPFKHSFADRVFSYSVLQHLGRDDVAMAVSEIRRVLKENGVSTVQMPVKFGLRCLYHQMRRNFRDGVGFEVRYWSLLSLRKLFSSGIGPTSFSIDCFFGIGLQFSDLNLMTPLLKVVVTASELFRLIGRVATPLIWIADSVYVSSVKK